VIGLFWSLRAYVGDGLSSETAPCDVGGSGEQRRHAEDFIILMCIGRSWRWWRRGGPRWVGGREHLDGFRRYAELADAIERLLEDTRSLAHWRTIL
jgi:hypothetical protein